MAGGKNPIGSLPGKVTATNALVVSSSGSGATGGGTAPIGNLQGVTSSNALVIIFT